MLDNGVVLYPTVYIGLDNADGLTLPPVAESPLLASRSMLLDVDVGSSTMLVYRAEGMQLADPFMMAHRSRLYASALRTTTELSNRFSVLREPNFKRANVHRV